MKEQICIKKKQKKPNVMLKCANLNSLQFSITLSGKSKDTDIEKKKGAKYKAILCHHEQLVHHLALSYLEVRLDQTCDTQVKLGTLTNDAGDTM